jgi:flagellar basal body P-ring formation protein FlgA
MTQFLLTIIILLGCIESSLALEITFLKSAQVDDAVVRLGDVAKFDQQTPMASALATQPVGQAPTPGSSLVLRSQNIKQYLVSNQSIIGEDISWSGAPSINVTRQGIVIDQDRVQAIIAEFLSKSKNLPKAEIRFIPSSLPLPFAIPKGELSCEVIPSNPGIISSSSFSLIFKVNGNVVKNMSVRGKLEVLAKIIVAAEPLKKGLIIKPQHLKSAVIDINEIANPESDPHQLIGMQLNRNLGVDTPVLASMVEALPVVKRGQRVKIIAESGTLHLTATGFAQSDGKIDQVIKVQNIQSTKTVYGKVTSPGIVEVLL